jgi:Domain of unknown function (DUF4398)
MNTIRSHFLQAGAAAIALVLLGACATTPPPNEKLAVAKAAVERADKAGAPTLAPTEMATAREKLARAEKAQSDSNVIAAGRWADQANVDAQLAEATAGAEQSHKAAAEYDASLQALRQESMRATPTN